jgi:transposase
MIQEELRRVEVLARVRSHQLGVSDAARLMRVSYRQAKRLWKRYREEGAVGLKHGNAGRESKRACPPKFRRQVLDLVRKKYGGDVGERFGPTLAAEHLGAEDNLQVNAETLRLWMLQAGLWSRERKRRKHRRRRERKEHFGEMVQMDGSFHPWMEESGAEGCLIDMVDDATNTTWAQLGEQETDLGGGRWAAGLDRTLRSTAGALRGLEEPVQAESDAERTTARRGAFDAVWAHVREVGDRADRGQLAAGEGASGTDSRDTSGPAGEEAATEANQQSRTSQCISGAGLSAGTQWEVREGGGKAGGLPPAGAAGI